MSHADVVVRRVIIEFKAILKNRIKHLKMTLRKSQIALCGTNKETKGLLQGKWLSEFGPTCPFWAATETSVPHPSLTTKAIKMLHFLHFHLYR